LPSSLSPSFPKPAYPPPFYDLANIFIMEFLLSLNLSYTFVFVANIKATIIIIKANKINIFDFVKPLKPGHPIFKKS